MDKEIFFITKTLDDGSLDDVEVKPPELGGIWAAVLGRLRYYKELLVGLKEQKLIVLLSLDT